MEENKPEWRKDWKLDDPDWVKNRQADWKKIKDSKLLTYYLDKRDFKEVREFFMTGRASHQVDWNDESILWVSWGSIFELWLSPKINMARWEYIKQTISEEQFRDDKNQFFYFMKIGYPESGSLFSGRDFDMYVFYNDYVLDECQYDLSLEKDRERYTSYGSKVFSLCDKLIIKNLDSFNPEGIADKLLDDWARSVVPAFLFCIYFPDEYNLYLINFERSLLASFDKAKEIISNKESDPAHIAFANRFFETFIKLENIPEELAQIQEKIIVLYSK